jgi:glycerophosphoryl diester phosphodiesterase
MLLLASIVSAGQVKYIAHRGASYYAPENSLAAIRLAAELGCDGAECDIRLTRDNQIVLWHDEHTGRLTSQKLDIAKSTWPELKKLNIKLSATNSPFFEGEQIPLLKDVLKTIAHGQLLVIEIKCGKEIFPELQKVLKKYWKGGNIAFIGFGFETISQAKSIFPDIPCYYLSSSKSDVQAKTTAIRNSKLDGVDLSSTMIDKELVEFLRSAGLEIWCWTVDAPAEANRMKNLGVNVITTNRPTWLKEQMAVQNIPAK